MNEKFLNDPSKIPELAKLKGGTVEFGEAPDELTRAIDGATYDTEKSEVIETWLFRNESDTATLQAETLYKTKSGGNFVLIESRLFNGDYAFSFTMFPLDRNEAKEWKRDRDRRLVPDFILAMMRETRH